MAGKICRNYIIGRFCDKRECVEFNFAVHTHLNTYSGTSLRRTPLGPTKIVHYREGVLWSVVYNLGIFEIPL